MTTTNNMTKILGDVEMVANPEVDGGLVSANEVPLDDARRMVRELTAAGFVADWAPAEKSEHSRDAYAWIYVGGEPIDAHAIEIEIPSKEKQMPNSTIKVYTFSNSPSLAFEEGGPLSGYDADAVAVVPDSERALALYTALEAQPNDCSYQLGVLADGRLALVGDTVEGHRFATETDAPGDDRVREYLSDRSDVERVIYLPASDEWMAYGRMPNANARGWFFAGYGSELSREIVLRVR